VVSVSGKDSLPISKVYTVDSPPGVPCDSLGTLSNSQPFVLKIVNRK
jgi:hypothetical protein